ncbi:MAG: site-specific DNA-methyltransferase [Defluviitaleaceae bacterium]|nr:site-specific DNA-methyltransferase [Defluviitaleaceae bacterium]
MPVLNWIGKEKVVNHHRQVPYRILESRYAHGLADSGNMIVHGDNLDALKALLPRYEGRVKLVYIDPPYNTGNEKWVYNDNVNDPKMRKWLGEVVGKEGEDLSRHDKWLCMMYPRLKLLHRLLADDGVIFISIDDNEVFNLKFVCDEIFGNKNFISAITVVGNPRGRDYGGIARMHDYILVYKKSSMLELNLIQDKDNNFVLEDELGGFELRELRNRNIRFNKENRPNLYYPFYIDPASKDDNGLFEIWLEPKSGLIEHYPLASQGINVVWRWGKQKSQDNLNVNIKAKAKRDGGYQIVEKYREARMMARSVWWDKDTNTEKGTLLVKEIFEDKVFDYPKPLEFMMRIIEMGTDAESDDIILDSFAGSGTTAHAVLNMNKQDGGNRKFILVEMEDYAEGITAERVRRVIDGYGNTEGTGGSFTYYELGERLLLEDGNLNEDVDTQRICEYVWYTETRSEYVHQDEYYLLGVRADTAYYFYYEKDSITTLDHSFLQSIKAKVGGYLIYADINTLSAEEMDAKGIRFKKIPRDISRL